MTHAVTTQVFAPTTSAEGNRPASRTRWHTVAITVTAAYVVLTAAIMLGSPLDHLDLVLYRLDLVPSSSPAYLPVSWFVFVGQGVPASTVAALYAISRSARTRRWTPWVMFTIALVLLNVSVGAVKHLTGRLGPKETDIVHTVWAGGTIFPSGHTANAVVMYGLIAMIAPAAYRRAAAAVAAALSVAIGLGTVALNTHWISDVFGGWLAGALVLLAVAPTARIAERAGARAATTTAQVLARWRAAAVVPVPMAPATPMAQPPPIAAGTSPTRVRTSPVDGPTSLMTVIPPPCPEVVTRRFAGAVPPPAADRRLQVQAGVAAAALRPDGM